MSYQLPVSVLVVVHTAALEVLLLERAQRPGYWQSVTGSLDWPEEPLAAAAAREVLEETGIDTASGRLEDWRMANTFEIYLHWRHRFAAGVTHNTEHVFSVEVPEWIDVKLAPLEHIAHAWLPWQDAAERVFSPSNAEAIRELPLHVAALRGSAGT